MYRCSSYTIRVYTIFPHQYILFHSYLACSYYLGILQMVDDSNKKLMTDYIVDTSCIADGKQICN